MGVQSQPRGAPESDSSPAGTESIIQPNSNGSITAVTPNNLSQSRLGLSGKESLAGDWSGGVRLRMVFHPQPGKNSERVQYPTDHKRPPPDSQSSHVGYSRAGASGRLGARRSQ